MLTHDDIMKLKLVKFPDGEIVSVDTDNKTGELVFANGTVHEEYYNLLRASAVLYQTLHFQGVALQQLVEAAEAIGADGIVPTLNQMKGPIEFALLLAEQGVENYIQEPKQ